MHGIFYHIYIVWLPCMLSEPLGLNGPLNANSGNVVWQSKKRIFVKILTTVLCLITSLVYALKVNWISGNFTCCGICIRMGLTSLSDMDKVETKTIVSAKKVCTRRFKKEKRP
jgi:hypothetical protein